MTSFRSLILRLLVRGMFVWWLESSSSVLHPPLSKRKVVFFGLEGVHGIVESLFCGVERDPSEVWSPWGFTFFSRLPFRRLFVNIFPRQYFTLLESLYLGCFVGLDFLLHVHPCILSFLFSIKQLIGFNKILYYSLCENVSIYICKHKRFLVWTYFMRSLGWKTNLKTDNQ